MEGLSNGVQAMWGGVQSVLSGIGGAIKDMLTPDVDYAEMINNTRAQIEQLKADVASGYEQIKSVTIQNGQEMASATIQIYQAMSQSILAEVASMAAQIGAQTAVVATAFQGIFDSIKAQAITNLIAMSQEAVAQIGVMVSAIGQTLTGLIGVFSGIYGSIQTNTIAVLMSLQAAAQTAIAGMISSIQALISGLASSFVAIFEGISQGTLGVLTTLTTEAIAAITAIKTESLGVISSMSQSMIAYFTAMTGELIALTQTMSGTILAAIELMNSMVLNETNLLKSNYVSAWDQLRSQTISIVSTLSSQIQSLISQLASNILATMRSLVSQFRSIGQDMMNSLANGISSNMSQVTDITSSLVQKLKETFEGGLGIHSPSDYMIWIGQMMLAGLIEGMNQQQIAAFVRNIIEDMKTSFKNGKFNADELVNYMGDSGTMNVVKYLELIGDQTVSEMFNDGGVPAIIQEALKYVGYAPGPGNSIMGARYGNSGAWCASFVRYCAENVGVPFPATNYVPDVLAWAQANGRSTMTPQPGYAAIFGGGSHIELVAGVSGGTVDMVGGNTGAGEVKHRPRNDATSYVVLDGGHSTLTLKDTIMQAYNKKFNPAALVGIGGVPYNAEAGVEQWRSTVQQALQLLGQPQSLTDGVLYAIQCESSGNPNAINLTDSNAAAGHPSQGLLQTIPSTFAAYRNPNLPNSITDPLANIYAGLNYMIQRYGGIANVINPRLGGWYGYAKGTDNATRGLHWVGENGPELLQFKGGERVYPHRESLQIMNQALTLPDDQRLILNSPVGLSEALPNPFDPLTYNVEAINRANNSGGDYYVSPDSYQSGSGGTVTNTTNNSPINFHMNPTINTREEFNMSLEEMKSLMAKAIHDVVANNPEG